HRGYAKVTRDLTDRKRNEDALLGVLEREREASGQLREVNRLRSEVVGLIAHDLRAPLGVITNLVHLTTTDWDDITDVDKLHNLERIAARASTMSDLVDNVFDMARIEAGQLEVEHVPFDVAVVVNKAIDDVITSPSSRAVRRSIDSRTVAVGDARRTWQ